ncbi:MAG: VOC family protein [Bacteroidetes bacterium]|nr:VOC family protein [Bacteroidota bacterium]
MKLDHVAIWTTHLATMKTYYATYFGGVAGKRYKNSETGFTSYFLSFSSGARLELMAMHDIPENKNDTRIRQHQGLIHLAFGAGSISDVEEKAGLLLSHGFQILSGPRLTGDGYFEFETLDPDSNRIEVTYKIKPD